MVRIDDQNPTDKLMIEEAHGKIPKCTECGRKVATIWIRGYSEERGTSMFLCDNCAFHLARILMLDIGHPKDIVPKST